MLEHPRLGPILFDTGYTPCFFRQTQRFPYNIYAKITPVYVDKTESACHQLKAKGISPTNIKYLIISHFHADHIGGLADFPQAQYVYFRQAYEAVKNKRGIQAVRAGFLPGLIPPDFTERSRPIDMGQTTPLPPEYAPFSHGVDIFGDSSLLAVSLPGHAHGQMGLFMQTNNVGPVFLAADACWRSQAYQDLIWPHPLANLVLADAKAYRQTLSQLHHLHKNNPAIHIVPSHCSDVL